MECLICYRVEVNFEAEKYKQSATTFCQIFGLPATSEEPFYSSTVCDLCLQRLADIEVMLREIQQIQENVNKVKSEMEKDLLNSQRLSEEESKISEQRIKIINEINSRGPTASLEEPDDISTHFLATQPSSSSLVLVKLEEGGSQLHQIEDSDNFQLDFFPPSPANDSSEPLSDLPNAEKPMKNAIILVEKLPVLAGGSAINVNQEPIKSYTLRNHPLRSIVSNSQAGQNIQEKRGQGWRKGLFGSKKRRKKGTVIFAKPKARKVSSSLEERKKAWKLSLTCPICEKVFNRRNKVQIHMNRVHEGGEPTFLCQECGKAFFTKASLQSHLTSHGIGKDVVICQLCGKPLKNQAICDQHVSVVHLKAKPYNCAFCEERFAYEHQLNSHWKVVHLGEKIFCPEPGCGKEFKSKLILHMHTKRVHRGSNGFQCSECGREFAWNAELQVHIRRVHLKEKDRLCEHCPARFFLERDLRNHVKFKHLKIRPAKCTFCSKGFTDNLKLKRHLALHSAERPFVCQYCGEAYQVESSLKLHIDHKHSENRGKHLIADPNKRRKVGRRTRVQVVKDPCSQIQDPINIS